MKNIIKKTASILAFVLVLTNVLSESALAATTVTPKLNATKKTIYVGKSYTFKVKNKIKNSTFTWSTSDKTIATVNKTTGKTTGKAPGKATISCTMTIGTTEKVLTADVTIKQSATAISIKNPPSDRTMLLGDTYDFNRKLTPKKSTDKTYWVINPLNNTAEATVSSSGVVTPKKEGTFTIKAVAANTKAKYEAGNISAQSGLITITVKSPTPELVSIKTTDSKTMIFEFNQDIEDVAASNFGIYTSNNVVCSIKSVVTNDNKVIATLNSSLINNSTYKVSVLNIKAKGKNAVLSTITRDVTYTKATPSTIELLSTTVAIGDVVEYIIKDSNGNDITKDYPVTDLVIGTSNNNVVGMDLRAITTGTEVISISIPNTNVRISNQAIYVVASRAIPTAFSEVTLGAQGTNILTLYRSDMDKAFNCSVVDKEGKVIANIANKVAGGDAKFEFVSSNPTVLGVDLTTGTVVPISKGNAAVKITATVNNITINTTVTVTVKEDAYVDSLKVSKSSVKIVKDSGIVSYFDVELLDQYGEPYTKNAPILYSVNNATRLLVANDVNSDEAGLGMTTINAINGKTRIILSEKSGATLGDTVITISAGGKNVNVIASLVSQGTFVKYVTEISSKNLDINTSREGLPSNVSLGERVASVAVYMLDNNGNYMGYAEGVTLATTNTSGNSPVSVVSYNGHSGAIMAEKVGTEAIMVKVGTAVIETIIITVIDSRPVITDVIQNNEKVTISKGESISFLSDVSSVFTAKDQYKQNISITFYETVSLNSKVVTAGGMSVYALEEGTADIVVSIKNSDGTKVADKVVTVVVTN